MKTDLYDSKIDGRAIVDSAIEIDHELRQIIITKLPCASQDFFEIMTNCKSDFDRINKARTVVDLGAFVHNKVERAMDTGYFDKEIVKMTSGFQEGLRQVKTELLELVESKFDPDKQNSYTDKFNKIFGHALEEFEKSREASIRELKNGKQLIADKIDESFNPELRTSHLGKLLDFVEKFREKINRDFDQEIDGSILNQMKQMIQKKLGDNGELVKLIDSRLSLNNPNSAIKTLYDDFMKKLEEIKVELAATKSASEAEQAVLEKSPQKGFQFQDIVLEKLEQVAKQNGDFVEDLSNQAGDVAHAKTGDFVYTVTALKKRIAIEAKNTKMKSLKQTIEMLEKTRENRNADFVILLHAEEDQLHNQVGTFQEYDFDKVITHFTFFEVALKIAISRLMLDNNMLDGIDRNTVEKELESINNSLKSMRTMKTAANTILREAQKIANKSDEIKTEIANSIANLSDLLLSPDCIKD